MKLQKLMLCAFLACSMVPAIGGEWVVRPDGIGPLRIGMRFDEVGKRVGAKLEHDYSETPSKLPHSCERIGVPGRDGIFLMFIDEVLKRVEVLPGGNATVRGIAVGDPVSRVLATYPNSEKTKDFYDDREQFITVRSKDRALALRFGTGNGQVAWFIAGAAKEVDYVEGCL